MEQGPEMEQGLEMENSLNYISQALSNTLIESKKSSDNRTITLAIASNHHLEVQKIRPINNCRFRTAEQMPSCAVKIADVRHSDIKPAVFAPRSEFCSGTH